MQGIVTMESEVLNYFETQAKSGDWESLYNPQNPKSYPFIIRLQKTLNLLEDIDNKKICDLGCGTGVLIPFILKKNGNYTGIDFSKRMLGTIRSKYQKEIKATSAILVEKIKYILNITRSDGYADLPLIFRRYRC